MKSFKVGDTSMRHLEHPIYHYLCQQNIKQNILFFFQISFLYTQISSYGVTPDVVCHNIEVKIGR